MIKNSNEGRKTVVNEMSCNGRKCDFNNKVIIAKLPYVIGNANKRAPKAERANSRNRATEKILRMVFLEKPRVKKFV